MIYSNYPLFLQKRKFTFRKGEMKKLLYKTLLPLSDIIDINYLQLSEAISKKILAILYLNLLFNSFFFRLKLNR